MGKPEKKCGIFICYRQDDAKAWALRLHDELAHAFGRTNVFLDKDTLHAGNWQEQIQEALSGCKAVVIVMGRRWLTLTDIYGKKRLNDPNDVHRHEIAVALSLDGVTVIPVRVDGAAPPAPEDLPESIRALAYQQSLLLSDNSAHLELDFKILVNDIEQATGLVAKRHRIGSGTSSWPLARALALAAIASMVLLIIAEVGLGWSLDVQEKTFVVFIVLLLTISGIWFRNRVTGSENDKT